MLSGEILNGSALSVAFLANSPTPELVELFRTMAALAALTNNNNQQQSLDDDDNNVFLENGLLSYENPNYHMDPQHMERNTRLYDEIFSELHQQGTLRPSNGREQRHQPVGRKTYAKMDIGQMGVDLKENFNSPDNKKIFMDMSPDHLDKKNEIKYIKGEKNENDLYALPNKRREEIEELEAEEERVMAEDDEEEKGKKEVHEGIEDKDMNKDLPPGWEKHEDNEGPYYWHIRSGTIQREPPTWPKECRELRTPIIPPHNNFNYTNNYQNRNLTNSFSSTLSSIYGNRDLIKDTQPLSVTRSNTSFALDHVEEERRRREELAYKRRSYPLKSDSESRPIRFAVRSLGWVEIAEEDLTPERSSKAVNKCIVDLSLGKNDLLDVVGRWGDGKDLFMDLDEGALKLIDPENLTILNTQPIHTIRVWGVGRDNGRDFAYVARDRMTRIHMCHVFRCDTAARTIANTLRDICKKIMIERTMQSDSSTGPCGGQFSGIGNGTSRSAIRPTDLPTENRRWIRHPQSFPTPMEEPKKVIRAQYMGAAEVQQACGMDVLNAAIDHMAQTISEEQLENVTISVAPSMISVNNEHGQLLSECRVRYLSFLGIGQDVKKCAFIMHTAQDKFVAHVFHCEPSSGHLCKTIEAACKLRYQKCLDAHPNHSASQLSSGSPSSTKGLGATIKNFVTSLAMKKDKFSS